MVLSAPIQLRIIASKRDDSAVLAAAIASMLESNGLDVGILAPEIIDCRVPMGRIGVPLGTRVEIEIV